MGKRKDRTPQAQHGKKSSPARHDKRDRLGRRNSGQTEAASLPLVGVIATLATGMSRLLENPSGEVYRAASVFQRAATNHWR